MKKIGLMVVLIVAAVVFTVAFPAIAAGPKAPAPPVAGVPAMAMIAAIPERHPHIDEALEAMRNAKRQLETAEHDFGGHRAKALEHLDRAIREAEICMTMR